MKQLSLITLILLLSFGRLVQAESEPDIKAVTEHGKQVWLKSDHTWNYVEFVQGDPAVSAVLTVTRVWDMQEACKVQFSMQNNLGYKIHSLVPRFAIVNQEGVVYDTPSISFVSIMPTKKEYTNLLVSGLGCQAISHFKLIDASRCRMGDIDIWNEQPGQCSSHLYLEPSQQINISR